MVVLTPASRSCLKGLSACSSKSVTVEHSRGLPDRRAAGRHGRPLGRRHFAPCVWALQHFGWKGDCLFQDTRKQLDVAKQLLQWRWLIIDEISIVSAKLLAEVELTPQSLVRTACPYKQNAKGVVRPFGGLSMLCSGDFWQLPPPKGNLPWRHPL